MMPSAVNDEQGVLSLWEHANGLNRFDRDDALITLGSGAQAPRVLGQRQQALVSLRARLFGQHLQLRSSCPSCTSTAEFDVDCALLASSLADYKHSSDPLTVECDGWRANVRVPDIEDLRAATQESGDSSELAVAHALLRMSMLDCHAPDGEVQAPSSMPAALADAISNALDRADPGAAFSFMVTCPECDAPWDAPLDMGGVLWSEIQTRAERILLEVDAIARVYGWTEPQVLALSPARRAAYLQLATSTS